MVKHTLHQERQLMTALLVSSLASVFLFVARAIMTESDRYWFLLWNLILAWVPFLAAGLLYRQLKTHSWWKWQSIVLSLIWIGFLPNSFYMASDLVHLQFTGEVSLVYDAGMFMSFALSGFLLGFISLYLVHRELIKRFMPLTVHVCVAVVLALCGYAIYLGRYLRWNTWDVIINPAGLLFDLSDNVLHPHMHIHAFTTTFTYFVLLGSLYFVVWQLAGLIRQSRD